MFDTVWPVAGGGWHCGAHHAHGGHHCEPLSRCHRLSGRQNGGMRRGEKVNKHGNQSQLLNGDIPGGTRWPLVWPALFIRIVNCRAMPPASLGLILSAHLRVQVRHCWLNADSCEESGWVPSPRRPTTCAEGGGEVGKHLECGTRFASATWVCLLIC